MTIRENYSLQAHHTFHLPVSARWYVEYGSTEELKNLLQTDLVKQHPLLHIGGGSNLLFTKDYEGVVLHSAIRHIEILEEDEDSVQLSVGAGVVWDDFVSHCVENNWGGVENLSLIPGEAGASAVQNIGAYGVEVKDVIERVNVVEVSTGQEYQFTRAECRYGYRESIFKKEWKGRFIVTSVVYRVQKNPVFNLTYGHLEEALSGYGEITLKNIRETVIAMRNSKLPDPDKTGSAGSFFMNPVIARSQYDRLKEKYPDMPHYPVDGEQVKVPAGWLIDRCGWKGREHGGAAVHDKQCLVLVNKRQATAKDIMELAEMIQNSVKETYDIAIVPEVNFI
ncbi:MAG: UDP-N-acetylmuramate dehydrogenase [Coprobacter sp.]|nr:UDP-N-acetylmuramate dehydrogenase [Coprobacter sp.]